MILYVIIYILYVIIYKNMIVNIKKTGFFNSKYDNYIVNYNKYEIINIYIIHICNFAVYISKNI